MPREHLASSTQVDADLITSLANEDVVEALLAELQEVMPTAAKPLLHDRSVGLRWGAASGCRQGWLAGPVRRLTPARSSPPARVFSLLLCCVRAALSHRNWVLATNSYRMAQHADGPVVAVVGKGHIPGMVFVVQQLVGWMAKTNGHPLRLVQHGDEGVEEEDLDDGEAAVAATAASAAAMS
jgi:hypothetical protein